MDMENHDYTRTYDEVIEEIAPAFKRACGHVPIQELAVLRDGPKLIEALQLMHNHRADLTRGNFTRLETDKLPLDMIYRIFDLFSRNGTLLQRPHHAATQAHLVEGVATAIVLDHHGHIQHR